MVGVANSTFGSIHRPLCCRPFQLKMSLDSDAVTHGAKGSSSRLHRVDKILRLMVEILHDPVYTTFSASGRAFSFFGALFGSHKEV